MCPVGKCTWGDSLLEAGKGKKKKPTLQDRSRVRLFKYLYLSEPFPHLKPGEESSIHSLVFLRGLKEISTDMCLTECLAPTTHYINIAVMMPSSASHRILGSFHEVILHFSKW